MTSLRYAELEEVNQRIVAGPAQEIQAVRCHKSADLHGTVRLSGSKNIGFKLLTTTPMFREPVLLRSVPQNNQVRYLLDLLPEFGVSISVEDVPDSGLEVIAHTKSVSRQEFRYPEIRQCRHTFLLAMSVLLRTGSVLVPIPGYSHYGPRPVTGQLDGLKQMGAKVYPIQNGMVRIELPEGGLVGKEIFLSYPSNAVTEALLWAAIGAKGTTKIHGAAQEPETLEICRFFQSAGLEIEGLGSAALTIKSGGLENLSAPREFQVMFDRIEASTFGAAVTICGGEVTLLGVDNKHMAAVRATLRNIGTEVEENADGWLVRSKGRPRATDIVTGPFPGFPTDALGPYLAMLSTADGTSVIQERLWYNRLSLTAELRRMGAAIDMPAAQVAVIRGSERLSGAPVIGTDPRATAALILAGLFADGETLVSGTDLLDNAYDSFDEKLGSIGGRVQRVAVPAEEYGLAHSRYGRLEAF